MNELGSVSTVNGIPVYRTPYFDRETAYWLETEGALWVGTNLVRGVPYTAPGVTRGYLLDNPTFDTARLLDAATGALVTVALEDPVPLGEVAP